ncbi:MAG: endonuclease III [Gemmatimonadota bacterium]|nr:endonuclease III [Gemmatimonadota bacterium]
MPGKDRPPRKQASKRRTKPLPASRRPPPERAPEIFARLAKAYPQARCSLDFETPFQLLVATILSAQCTDKRVNMVTPKLFATYPTPAALAAAKQEEVEELVRTTGFFRSKAKSLLGVSAAIESRHGGEVPATLNELVELPGVGRKTANVILGNAFGRNEGVVVDTHVARVSQRLGLTRHTDPVKIEQDLAKLFPREQWTLLAHLLIEHGRQICEARLPKCSQCRVGDLCPSFGIGV